MTHGVATNQSALTKFAGTLSAGALASLVTQPFEVLKTNMIASSSTYMREIHHSIIKNGWSQYMRGGSIAVIRQAYGFSIYTNLITIFNRKIQSDIPLMNKFLKYSMSAVTAKYIAMIFEAPLTLIKTRLQANPSSNIKQELRVLTKNPIKQMKKGVGSTIARQGFYSLFHYNTYRYIKDDIMMEKFEIHSAFIPAFLAGIVAITISQPFQVIRSKIALEQQSAGVFNLLKNQYKTQGIRGFFLGFIPRLLRKPINSGICWTVVESFKSLQN